MSKIINKLAQTPLTDVFSQSSDVPQTPQKRARTLVNYIWVSESPLDENSDFLGIPPEQLERTLRNTQEYDEADVVLWLDYKKLDPETRGQLAQDANPFNLPNIQIRDLNTVPDYTTNPLTAEDDVQLFVKVDMARLQVLSHGFKTTDYNEIYYADMDVPDLKLRSPELKDIMDKYGLTLGQYYEDEIEGMCYENSYMAFRRGNGQDFLENWLIPASQEGMFHEDGRHDTGDTPALMSFIILQEKLGIETLGIDVCLQCGTRLPTKSHDAIAPYLANSAENG